MDGQTNQQGKVKCPKTVMKGAYKLLYWCVFKKKKLCTFFFWRWIKKWNSQETQTLKTMFYHYDKPSLQITERHSCIL